MFHKMCARQCTCLLFNVIEKCDSSLWELVLRIEFAGVVSKDVAAMSGEDFYHGAFDREWTDHKPNDFAKFRDEFYGSEQTTLITVSD